MELYEYWRLLIRHLPLLIFSSVIGLSGASYVNFVTVPQYSASADVFVTTPTTTIDVGSLATGSNFSEQRVVSYAQIISGPATLGPVIEKLDLGVTTSELARSINAFAPDGTVLTYRKRSKQSCGDCKRCCGTVRANSPIPRSNLCINID